MIFLLTDNAWMMSIEDGQTPLQGKVPSFFLRQYFPQNTHLSWFWSSFCSICLLMEEKLFIPCKVRVQKPHPALIDHSHHKQKTKYFHLDCKFFTDIWRGEPEAVVFLICAQHGNSSVILVALYFHVETEKHLFSCTSCNLKSTYTD